MVIQSIPNSYTRIPDEEDVTPIDSGRPGGKWTKSVALTLAGLTVSMVLGTYLFYILADHRRHISIYMTSKDQSGGLHAVPTAGMAFQPIAACSGSAHIHIDSSHRYQTILGFGGAFTEAAAINYHSLPEEVQREVMDAYFSDAGLRYSMGRVPIGSCDFSPAEHSFWPEGGVFDKDVAYDQLQLLPFIRTALRTSSRGIRLLASPWSPPAWMKEPFNHSSPSGHISSYSSMSGSAQPNGLLLSRAVQGAWASYLSQWVTAYAAQGVDIWGLTVQNEPEFAAPWEACAWDAAAMQTFITSFLGPLLRREHPQLQLLAFDHNKDHLLHWAQALYTPEAVQYIDGMAFHWYAGDDRELDGTYGYNNVNATSYLQAARGKHLLGTEGCSCPGVHIDDYLRGERTAHDILFDLLANAHGWIDWNLLLDARGGPNHANNYCDAPLIVNAHGGGVHYQPKYFHMGHFAKFLSPGSVRVASRAIGNYSYSPMSSQLPAGVELGMFACEASARQIWQIDSIGRIVLRNPSVPDWDSASNSTVLCAAHGNSNRNYFRAADCSNSNERLLKVYLQPDTHKVVDLDSGLCLSLAADIRDPGALLDLTPCIPADRSADHQLFALSRAGEIRSLAPGIGPDGLCMTAGWPFLTAVAFNTPEEVEGDGGATAVVLMNEAPAATTLVLHRTSAQGQEEGLEIAVPRRSILTVLF